MPSRKKAQGRRNRARKEATRTAELRSLWEPMALCRRINHVAVPCEHTLTSPPEIPQEGPVVSFMNHIAGEGIFDKASLFPNESLVVTCIRMLAPFPVVWKKDYERAQSQDDERALAIDLLLRFLRNVLVCDSAIEGENWFHQSTLNEVMICCMIYLLELFGRYSALAMVRRKACKMGNKLLGGNRRDIVKFVAKRLPCTCLKGLHRAARRKVEKEGLCLGCYKRFPRSELFVCTGCMCVHYCSRECQRSDWSRHKKHCGDP
ncbi:hypothetical protein THAOC_35872 [Thalassiosira oceanica]|uniref:MYND-type domain-containing protein n=1 Tax=Thalassiosira oceanica TaxID=159749 RepID=K0RFZ5_THAOC|nr:hypothetical protein THAOC_35872 [Thalassiosira oceanica]|eukprot:EJK45512.1 hypothetical protein THAOC_35872 [Thalassiosira oceanica]